MDKNKQGQSTKDSLEVTVRVRLSDKQREKAKNWANAYEDDLSAFFRRMLDSLPDIPPPPMPKPPIKL